MRIVAVVLVGGCWTSAPIASAPPLPRAAPKPQAERWVGTGHQYDDDSHWFIELVIDPTAQIGARLGTVRYPSLGCRGVLTRVSDRQGELVAVEHIVDDPDQHCIDNGQISIPRERGMSFRWRWRYPETGEEGADAQLDRVIRESPHGHQRR